MTTSSAREQTARLAELLRREHTAMADFLLALAEFDRERAWERLGYPSLFSFLRRELRLSAGAAQYRKTAAELVRRYPQVEQALRSGELCLSSVVELGKVVTTKNIAELLPRFFGLSARDAAAVAASIRPVEDPPLCDVVTIVRAASVPAAASSILATATPRATASSLFAAPEALTLESVRTSEVGRGRNAGASSVALSARPPPRDMEVEPLDGDLRRLHVTVSRRILEKLDAARDALSHSHPGARAGDILEVALDLVLERQAKRRGLAKSPRKPAPRAAETVAEPSPGADARGPRSRYIPAEVRRAVWERDRGCCQWKLDGGGICGSTFRVEFDHIEGWAKGAGSTVDELQLLCDVHQDVSARQLYGDAVMDRYTRRKGGTCSEPVATYGSPTRSRTYFGHPGCRRRSGSRLILERPSS